MLKKLLFLIIIGFCISCKQQKGANASNTVHDSILFYYNVSRDQSVTLGTRYQAVNRSFFFLKKTEEDTIHSQLLYQKNLLHFLLNEYDSLLIYNDRLVNHALETKDDLVLAKQYYLMGYYFAEVSRNNDKAFQSYTLSKTYFEKTKDSSWVGRNLLNMATIQKNQNDFFGSKETLTEALIYFNHKKDRKYIASCYNTLATNHRKLLNYPDAKSYYEEAIETSDSEKDRLIYKNNLATTYIDNKEYNNSIILLESIVKDSLLKNDPKEYVRVLDNLAYAQWLNGNTTKAKSFLQSLMIRKQKNYKRGQIASYTHLGEFYSKSSPEKAKLYFDSVIRLSKTTKTPRAEKDAIEFLMQLEPKNVSLRDRYVFLQDSLYKQELKVKTQFAKYKYDDMLKQESILLLEKEKAIQELRVTKERNYKILYLFGFVMTLIGMGFVAYYKNQQKRKEKLMVTNETEKRISKRIHDELANDVFQVMMQLEHGNMSVSLVDKTQQIYHRTRDISKQLQPIDVGEAFAPNLYHMLSSYTPDEATIVIKGLEDIDWRKISGGKKTNIYRVLQEFMTNMLKHSKASLIAITFEKLKRRLKITYSDNGEGTDDTFLKSKGGLLNMENRISAINGSITFETSIDNGFNAEVKIPV